MLSTFETKKVATRFIDPDTKREMIVFFKGRLKGKVYKEVLGKLIFVREATKYDLLR